MGKIIKSVLTIAAFAIGTIVAGPVTGLVAAGVVNSGVSVLEALTAPSRQQIDEQAGSKVPVNNTADTRKIIYGKQRVAGLEVFADEYDRSASNDVPNDTVVLARLIADHPVNAFGDFYLADEKISFNASGNANSTKFGGKLFLKTHDGKNNSVDSFIRAANSGWTTNHIGEGLSYISLRAYFDQEVFPYGISELQRAVIEVEGKLIYDPRKDGSRGGSGNHRINNPDTWEYSTNPALCIYDYLRDETLGNPVPDDEINLNSIIVAANICDEQIEVKSDTAPSKYISRYTLNGVVDAGRDKLSNVNTILTAMGGRIMWLGGEIHIYAAAPRTATHILDEDVIISAEYDPVPPAEQRYNEVRGTFISPEDHFNPQDFPYAVNSLEQQQEGERALSLNLPYTQDHRIAQRLAKISLVNSRQALLRIDALPAAAAFAPMDVVAISWKNFGLEAEDFRIVSQTISDATGDRPITVSLTLVREEYAAYAWSKNEEKARGEVSPGNNTNQVTLAAPSGVNVMSEILSSVDGSKQTSLRISWNAPHATVLQTYVDYRVVTSNGVEDWVPGNASVFGDTDVRLLLPSAQTYAVRVRHLYIDGRYSAFVQPSAISTATLEGVSRLQHRGEYSPIETYQSGDVVTYLGSSYVYVANNPANGNAPGNTAYWGLVASVGEQGDAGPQGVQGANGADGLSRYTWIRYADDAVGSGISNNPTGKAYHGFAYNQLTSIESNVPSDYIWSKVQGEQGNTGVRGADGVDGTPRYTWIKYSPNSNGSNLTDQPNSGTNYIGIATNKTTASESNTASDYLWSKFKGDNGVNGADGTRFLSGSAFPSNSLGNNGDYYIRTTNNRVYERINGIWVFNAYYTDLWAKGALAGLDIIDTDNIADGAITDIVPSASSSNQIIGIGGSFGNNKDIHTISSVRGANNGGTQFSGRLVIRLDSSEPLNTANLVMQIKHNPGGALQERLIVVGKDARSYQVNGFDFNNVQGQIRNYALRLNHFGGAGVMVRISYRSLVAWTTKK